MDRRRKLSIVLIAMTIAGIGVMCFEIGSVLYSFFTAKAGEGCGTGLVTVMSIPGEEDTVIRQGDVSSHRVAITCNVDWGEDVLPSMLETLKKNDLKITFFISGKWAKKNPDLFRRIYVAGHEIQSHGYGHKLCSAISREQMKEEIERTSDVFYELIGERPTVFAPPSGDYNADTVQLCRELKCKLSLWSADTVDWRPGSTASIIMGRILKKDLNGGIILMHPKPETAKALPGLIEEIEKQRLEIVPLCQLGVY